MIFLLQAGDPEEWLDVQSEGRRSVFQLEQPGRESEFSLQLFVLFRSSVDWLRTTHIGEGNLLISSRDALRDTPESLNQASGHPEAQSS